jgi:CubicO group peptidase (beta-lactamase class C family)
MPFPSAGAPRWQARRGALLAAAALLLGGSGSGVAQTAALDPDRAPPALDFGWEVATPSSAGFDPAALEALAAQLARGEHGQVDGLLVVRDGKLVFERYFGGYTAYTLHTMQSVTKSVASVLVGIAIDRGYISSVDQPLHELFPEYRHLFEEDPAKKEITLHHLLSMTPGLDWPEFGRSYGPDNIVWAFAREHDWPGFVLSRPLETAPGASFNYSTGFSTLLGVVLQNATGMRADLFAERYLFDPLGITNYGWFRNTTHPDRWVHTGGGLHLMPRDLAKIGQLFVDGGRWGDQQVLSPGWIEASARPLSNSGREPHEYYGYQWWLRPLVREGGPGTRPNDVVHAAGIGGQHLFVVPSLKLVVVFTGNNFADAAVAREPIGLLYQRVLPALVRP